MVGGEMGKWDERMLGLAENVGSFSKDPSTQTGAVIVRPDKTVASLGYNGLPRGVEDSSFFLDNREIKYATVIHAEANAIVNAREPLHGYTIYVHPWPPCSNCAGLVIQAGIVRIVAPRPTQEQIERWGKSFQLAASMLSQANVELELV